jgi:hypothetical protein
MQTVKAHVDFIFGTLAAQQRHRTELLLGKLWY